MKRKKEADHDFWIVIKLIKRVFLLVSLPVELVISSIYVSCQAARLLNLVFHSLIARGMQWSIILTAPHLMLPPTSPDAVQGEPSSSGTGPSLFRIPLWMDLSMHLVPAVALLIGKLF